MTLLNIYKLTILWK